MACLLMISIMLISGCKRTVEVTLKYDANGETFPADTVEVHLSEADIEGNKVFKTDSNGKFSGTFKKEVKDVQYFIYMQNDYFSFHRNGCKTPIVSEQGTVTLPDADKHDKKKTVQYELKLKNDYADIWYYIQRAARTVDYSKTPTVKQNRKKIPICPGLKNAFNPADGTMMIKEGRPYLNEVIAHEYGHALMLWAVSGRYDARNCQTHFIRKKTDPTCAWVEGWADFFSVYSRYYYDHSITPTFRADNIEKYCSPIIGKDGYKDEGRVAAGLWDLFDEQDDCAINSGLYPDKEACGASNVCDKNKGHTVSVEFMLDNMLDLYTASVRTFYKKLREALPDQPTGSPDRHLADGIMYYNHLSRQSSPTPPP